jgi:UDP-N-acetylmuramate--alanine ligase
MMGEKCGVAVAGTHGKTTTTSMIVWSLLNAGLDPTFIVGGVMQALGTNARAGQGSIFVIEADEYDRMFLGLRPTVAVVTHLEHDHPDCYPTFEELREAFEQFLAQVPDDGVIVGCGDQPAVVDLLQGQRGSQVVTCGLSEENEWYAQEVWPNGIGGYDMNVVHKSTEWGCARLPLPGLHNVQNALLAIAAADWLGVEGATIRSALASFAGVARRFETQVLRDGLVVVDDYAHHPTKIEATLKAARGRYPDRPLWAVFQPHTFSRTKALWTEFTTCFAEADHVVVLDVYPAREKDTLGVSAQTLASEVEHPDVHYIPDFEAAAHFIVRHLTPDAVVITLSAGDGNQVGARVAELWQESHRQGTK